MNHSTRSTECAICLEPLEAEEEVPIVLPCKHGFHPKCIKRWIVYKKSCPVCRAETIRLP